MLLIRWSMFHARLFNIRFLLLMIMWSMFDSKLLAPQKPPFWCCCWSSDPCSILNYLTSVLLLFWFRCNNRRTICAWRSLGRPWPRCRLWLGPWSWCGHPRSPNSPCRGRWTFWQDRRPRTLRTRTLGSWSWGPLVILQSIKLPTIIDGWGERKGAPWYRVCPARTPWLEFSRQNGTLGVARLELIYL